MDEVRPDPHVPSLPQRTAPRILRNQSLPRLRKSNAALRITVLCRRPRKLKENSTHCRVSNPLRKWISPVGEQTCEPAADQPSATISTRLLRVRRHTHGGNRSGQSISRALKKKSFD